MKVSRSNGLRMRALWLRAQESVAAQQRTAAVDAGRVGRIRQPQAEPYNPHPVAALGKTQDITPVSAVRLDLSELPPRFAQLKGRQR